MIQLNFMGYTDGGNIRIDVWFEEAYVGDLRLTPEQWEVLDDAEVNGELVFELNR